MARQRYAEEWNHLKDSGIRRKVWDRSLWLPKNGVGNACLVVVIDGIFEWGKHGKWGIWKIRSICFPLLPMQRTHSLSFLLLLLPPPLSGCSSFSQSFCLGCCARGLALETGWALSILLTHPADSLSSPVTFWGPWAHGLDFAGSGRSLMRGTWQLTYAAVLLALQDLNTICSVMQDWEGGIAEMSVVLLAPFAIWQHQIVLKIYLRTQIRMS